MAKQKSAPKTEQVGNLKSEVREIEIDNPMFSRDHMEGNGNRRKATAFLNMNESLAAHWWHKGLIDEAEYKAASEFRRLWERSGGRGAGALDYTKEKVDGGGMDTTMDLGRMMAAQKLADIHANIGSNGYDLLVLFCGQCVALGDIFPTRHQQNKQSKLCREMLDHLSVHMGYKNRPIKAYRA